MVLHKYDISMVRGAGLTLPGVNDERLESREDACGKNSMHLALTRFLDQIRGSCALGKVCGICVQCNTIASH